MVHVRLALFSAAVLCGIAASTISCGGPFACTEAGCSSSLTLELTTAGGAVPEAFTATLTWRDDASTRTHTLDCPRDAAGAGDCAARRLFLQSDSFPESARLVVETPSSGRFEGDVTLEWKDKNRPNGSFCPPECASATTRVVLQ
jgi:hypothetical protein